METGRGWWWGRTEGRCLLGSLMKSENRWPLGNWISNARNQVMVQEQTSVTWDLRIGVVRNPPILRVTSDVGVEMERRNASLERRRSQSRGVPERNGLLVFPQQMLAEHTLCLAPF